MLDDDDVQPEAEPTPEWPKTLAVTVDEPTHKLLELVVAQAKVDRALWMAMTAPSQVPGAPEPAPVPSTGQILAHALRLGLRALEAGALDAHARSDANANPTSWCAVGPRGHQVVYAYPATPRRPLPVPEMTVGDLGHD